MLIEVPIIGPNGGGTHVIDITHEQSNWTASKLVGWGARDHGRPSGYQRVTDAIDVLDDALTRLGDRDRNGVRQQLTEHRDRLVAAVTAAEALAGESLTTPKPKPVGAAYLSMIATLEEAYRERNRASAALATCRDVAAAKDVRAVLDVADAGLRQAHLAIERAREAATFPGSGALDVTAFATAREQSTELVHLAKTTSQPARALYAALTQGREAPPAVAKLWICYTPKADVAGELFAWRWRAYAEEHGQ